MEKRSYVKPILSGEEFVPQNYIAACGDENKVYKFECNAPEGNMYVSGYVNGRYYTPCGEKHETPTEDTYYDGFIDRNNNGKQDNGEEVKVYLEFNRYGNVIDGHATANLDMSTWETAKS